jgi:acetylornithine deacetylase
VSEEPIPAGDAQTLACALVRVDSQNPGLTPNGAGETACVALLRRVLDGWGFRTEVHEALPGRPNLLARVGDARESKRLMFSGHLDVVGIEGMVHAPFDGEERNGRLYARGAADMKGGVAAMCAAAWRAGRGGLAGEIVVALTADEEYESAGTRVMLERGERADAAIVGEPTRLEIMPAHRGFVWIEVEVSGRAAHGSRWDVGVDAIRHAGLLLAELDRVDSEELPRREHPLLGRASVHASTIAGGIGMSTYPDRCVLRLERRTLPGERAEDVVAEIERACAAVRSRRPNFAAEVRLLMTQGPSDVAVDAPIVRELESAMRACHEPVRVAGMSAWTDAALLNAAGVPAICFGPGDISLAHAAEEYIPLEEIDRAASVLDVLARRWCG